MSEKKVMGLEICDMAKNIRKKNKIKITSPSSIQLSDSLLWIRKFHCEPSCQESNFARENKTSERNLKKPHTYSNEK